MPCFEVLLLQILPKSSALPLGTVLAAQAKFIKNEWDFEYLYYTESDQVLYTINIQYYANSHFYYNYMIIICIIDTGAAFN